MRIKYILIIAIPLISSEVLAQNSFRQIVAEREILKSQVIEIIKETNRVVQEQEVAIRLKYNVPKRISKQVDYIIREREWRKASYNYIYNDSVLTRVKCKQEIDSIYRDSLNLLLIPIKGNNISGENVSFALRCRDTLALDNAQYQYIMDKALNMARLLYRNPRANIWNEEMEVLSDALTEVQLEKYFIIKYAKDITRLLYNGRKKIIDAGLNEQFDETTDIHNAYCYYLKQKMIKDIYRYRSSAQKKHLAELEKHKPAMVRMLETIEKNARIAEKESNKTNNEQVGKEFVW